MALQTWYKDANLGTSGGTTGTLRLIVNEDSTDINNNLSNCSYELQLIISPSSNRWRASSGSWSISGDTSNSGNIASMTYYSGTTTLASGTFPKGHSGDGTGSFSINFSFTSSYVFSGGDNLSGTLTRIPRQANITEAPNFNDEGNPTIKYNNAAGNSVTSLQARIENANATAALVGYRDVSKTGTSYTFNFTAAERTALCNACSSNSMTVKFVLKTVIGSNTYYSTVNKTMTLINANPTFSNFEFEDVNPITVALTGNNQYNVNRYSNITAIIPVENCATANKNAVMSKYRFIIGNSSTDINYSSTEDVDGTINNSTNGTYEVYAIDSRGNSTKVTKLATQVIDYQNVYINPTTSNVIRDNNQVGDNAILTLNGTFWNDSFGQVTNTIQSVSYKFKKTTSSTWINGTTPITLTISGNTFSFSGQIASDNVDTTWDLSDSYDIQAIITDELSTTTINLILNSGIPTLCLDKNGVGIMGKYDNSVGGYGQVNGNPLAYYPIGSIYMSVDPTNPGQIFGGTWESWGTGKVPIGVDTSDTAINAAEKTVGNKTHSHTIKHTHGVPGVSHNHGLGSGYAQIIIRSGSNGVEYNEKSTGSWTANYWSRGGSGGGGSSGPHTLGGALGGTTDNRTPGSATTNSQSTNDSGSGSSYQPSIACYMWKRTA